jgi:hypothetical protein
MPLLPYLLKVGDKAAEEVGKKIGGEALGAGQSPVGQTAPQEERGAGGADRRRPAR